MLDRWPEDARRTLGACMERAKPGDYAVFDADNTLWRYDLTEAMMIWLEARGRIAVEGLPAHRLPLSCRPGETVWSYYARLCEESVSVGYLWAAQFFSDFTVATLYDELSRMVAHGGPFEATRWVGDQRVVEAVCVPQPYEAQRQLVAALQSAGVSVWIVSASPEELVRRFAGALWADMAFPQTQICGVNLLLQWEDGRVDCGSMARERGETSWRNAGWEDATLTAWPLTPLTWFEGKVSGIRRWISARRPPLLVAGDSPNDLPMMREVDKERGLCLRVRANPSYDPSFQGVMSAAGGGGLVVDPEQLAPRRIVRSLAQ